MASIQFPEGKTTGGSTSGSGGIRISPDLSDGEKKAIKNRKAKVISCLKKHGMHVDLDNVPKIAVVVSGGGLTAAIGCLGSLWELKNQNLLDAVTYLPGCSGSTWCMAPLYEKGDWTQNLDSIATEMCDKLAGHSFDAKKGLEKLLAAAEQDNYSLTHFWAYSIVNYTTKEIIENGISSHQAVCENGSVPYPIYSAADKQQLDNKGRNNAGTWFQFTPHEAGYPLLGAFVSSKLFDSKFSNGKLQKKEPENDLCYLEAICSSAPADIEQIIKLIIEKIIEILKHHAPSPDSVTHLLAAVPEKHAEVFSRFSKLQMNINESAEDSKAVLENLLTSLSVVDNSASYQLVKLMNDRWDTNDVEEKENLVFILRLLLLVEFAGLETSLYTLVTKTVKCLWGWIWGTSNNFLLKSASMPSDITDTELRYYIDGGYANNLPFPCILRKQQNVQVIIAFEYSDAFWDITHAADYCKANNIPFPKIEIDPNDKSNPKDCYIFEGENVPTVILIPLFNRVTSEGKMQQRTSQFNVFHLQYNKEEIDTLIEISRKNVSNNIQKIKNAIQKKFAN
ncbi:cytosolic phospholipase A2 gamma-like [Rhinatrema bivittatum]|uniref:cytosolic phospholipase A2 gamma-like n=1 Tax=Rhinatrema bivittatum TaxID=194408 RepID=UPI00112784B6|nr:cytosolic phospholipase A2 gamma-like [Rhinatrema bivittatum]